MKKAELRKLILKSRNALSLEQRRTWDRQIFEKLVKYDTENTCSVYLCYVNYKSEVNTKDFILWCLEHKKAVFVPKVCGSDMKFYRITSWEDLKAGYQGILEPEALPARSFSDWIAEMGKKKAPIVRMLLPGAVFDRTGNRIGYGGGFYDRWLAKWEEYDMENAGKLEKIGLAYEMQVVEEIPVQSFDQKVDRMMTEERIL